jgi:hypothetical protein
VEKTLSTTKKGKAVLIHAITYSSGRELSTGRE